MRPHEGGVAGALALAAALLGAAGCAHYPVNAPLSAASPGPAYRFDDLAASADNTDELFVCLAFSGGGTRAAALSYGVMQKLRDTRIVWKGKGKSLLDEVDCISAVSGGSFTAAYYGLFGRRLFTDFRERFLETDVEGALATAVAKPWNWVALASPYYDRIDLAADYYDERLFEKKTFGDLAKAGRRPFVIINATDMANGERFEFTQDQFAFIGSDLGSFPVARAVAASSAFPILLSPITLRNHRGPGTRLPEATQTDLTLALQDFHVNRERYQWAKNRAAYADAARMPFVHLMDGGLADNIGVRAIDSAYRRGFLQRRLNEGRIERLLVIVVNARAGADDAASRQEAAPGVADVAYKTATVALDNYSFDSIEALKALLGERKAAENLIRACRRKTEERAACVRQEYSCEPAPGPKAECAAAEVADFAAAVDPHVADVDFEAIRDEARRRTFLSVPTTFTLDRDVVKALVDVGGELLAADPEFQKAIADLVPPG
jgi:NTE family protein